jgi:predicted NBD/HSP70 family sugar kinase
VLVDLSGTILARIDEEPPHQPDRNAIIANLKDMTRRVIRQSGAPPEKVFGVGAGLRRIVDPVTGVTHGWHVPESDANWDNFPLRDALSGAIQLPHVLVDDIVRMLGIAEAYYGAGGHDQDFLYILVDTGVGMAIMLAGRPYIGSSHIAGEIAHIPIPGKNTLCACGNVGCLEQLTSTKSLIKRLRQRMIELPVQSALRQNGEKLTIQEVLQAADRGDKLALPLILEAGEEFGMALAVVANLLGPHQIIIGGALSASEIYLDAARRKLKLLAIEEASRVAEIRRSALGEEAGALGAATVVLNRLFEPGAGSLPALGK